jgi:hypothetical protein
MDYFTIVEDTKAVVVSKGRYQQVDVYRRGTNVYVRMGGAFIRCLASGGTSVPNVRVEAMDAHDRIVAAGTRLQWKA